MSIWNTMINESNDILNNPTPIFNFFEYVNSQYESNLDDDDCEYPNVLKIDSAFYKIEDIHHSNKHCCDFNHTTTYQHTQSPSQTWSAEDDIDTLQWHFHSNTFFTVVRDLLDRQ